MATDTKPRSRSTAAKPARIPAGVAIRDYQAWRLHPQPGTVIAGAAHDAVEDLGRLDELDVDGQDVVIVAVPRGHGRGAAERIRDALG